MWDLSSPAFLLAWPQQESDCAFFKKHPLLVIVAFSTNPPLRQFPSLKRQEAPGMPYKSQIPGFPLACGEISQTAS